MTHIEHCLIFFISSKNWNRISNSVKQSWWTVGSFRCQSFNYTSNNPFCNRNTFNRVKKNTKFASYSFYTKIYSQILSTKNTHLKETKVLASGAEPPTTSWIMGQNQAPRTSIKVGGLKRACLEFFEATPFKHR